MHARGRILHVRACRVHFSTFAVKCSIRSCKSSGSRAGNQHSRTPNETKRLVKGFRLLPRVCDRSLWPAEVSCARNASVLRSGFRDQDVGPRFRVHLGNLGHVVFKLGLQMIIIDYHSLMVMLISTTDTFGATSGATSRSPFAL